DLSRHHDTLRAAARLQIARRYPEAIAHALGDPLDGRLSRVHQRVEMVGDQGQGKRASMQFAQFLDFRESAQKLPDPTRQSFRQPGEQATTDSKLASLPLLLRQGKT